jgi:hypothetical protein
MTVTVNMEEVMEMESGMGKGTRKPSDMNAPKRPLSAFFQWANKTRPSIMKENPEWGVAEIGKKLGSMWKKVPKSEVEGFQAKYDKAKKTYDAKLEKYKKGANYRKFQTELLAYKIHMTKKPFGPDPNAPKRSLSAYMLYAASVRDQIIKENPEMAITDVMKEQSVWWKALSEAQRKPWNEKSAAAKAKYEKLLAKYQKTSDYQNYIKEKNEYKTMMVAKRNKLMGIKLKKKRARNEDDSDGKKAKKVKRSSSRKSSRRRSARRARTPKAPKRRPRTSERRRKAARRRARAPKGTKRRSSSRSVSTSRSASKRRSVRRAKSPKAPKKSSSRASSRSSTRSRTPKKKKSSRRSRTPKSSKRRAAERRATTRRRRAARRAVTPKAPKKRSGSRRRSVSRSKSTSKRSARRSRTPKRRSSRRSKKSKRRSTSRRTRSASRSASRRSRTPKRRSKSRRKSKKRSAATPAAPASVVEVDTGAESSAM